MDTGGFSSGYELDQDGDGLPDWWEKRYFTDNVSAFPCDDDDADGMSNESEFIAGTIPNNANSLLEILSIDVLNKRVKIRWSSVSGKTYILERAEMNGLKFKIIKDNIKANEPESAIRINSEKGKSIYRIRIDSD